MGFRSDEREGDVASRKGDHCNGMSGGNQTTLVDQTSCICVNGRLDEVVVNGGDDVERRGLKSSSKGWVSWSWGVGIGVSQVSDSWNYNLLLQLLFLGRDNELVRRLGIGKREGLRENW